MGSRQTSRVCFRLWGRICWCEMANNGTSSVLERKNLSSVLQLYQPWEFFFKTWGEKSSFRRELKFFSQSLGSPSNKRTADTPPRTGGALQVTLQSQEPLQCHGHGATPDTTRQVLQANRQEVPLPAGKCDCASERGTRFTKKKPFSPSLALSRAHQS